MGKNKPQVAQSQQLLDFYPAGSFSSVKTISRVTVKLLIYLVH